MQITVASRIALFSNSASVSTTDKQGFCFGECTAVTEPNCSSHNKDDRQTFHYVLQCYKH